jgi:hypothetical protein
MEVETWRFALRRGVKQVQSRDCSGNSRGRAARRRPFMQAASSLGRELKEAGGTLLKKIATRNWK